MLILPDGDTGSETEPEPEPEPEPEREPEAAGRRHRRRLRGRWDDPADRLSLNALLVWSALLAGLVAVIVLSRHG